MGTLDHIEALDTEDKLDKPTVEIAEDGINKVISVGSVDGVLHWHGGTPLSENARSFGPGEAVSVWVSKDGEVSEITTITYFGENDEQRATEIRNGMLSRGLRVGI